MGILKRYIDYYTGYFSFAESGGAIGAYNLQVPVRINTVIIEFGVLTPIIPVGAGASISFDLINTGVVPNTTIVGALLPATAVTSFGTASLIAIIGRSPFTTSITATALAGQSYPTKSVVPFAVGMSISGAALTAGIFQFWCRVVGFDF
jgi:hypothetical protein